MPTVSASRVITSYSIHYTKLYDKQIPNDLPQALQGKVQLDDGRLYIGKDPKNPQVGDSRIEYLAVRPQEASLTAQQSGNRLVPGTGPDGQPFFRVSQIMAGMPENTPAASGISVSAVITSYSIHYTKLYERLPGFRPIRRPAMFQ